MKSTHPRQFASQKAASPLVPKLLKYASGLCLLLVVGFGATLFFTTQRNASSPVSSQSPVDSAPPAENRSPASVPDDVEALRSRVNQRSEQVALINRKLQMMQAQLSAQGGSLPLDVLTRQTDLNMSLANAKESLEKGALDQVQPYLDATQKDAEFLEHYTGP